MADEFVHNHPRDPTKEIFKRLEVHVSDNNHNMNLLMTALASKLGLFRDDGGSTSEKILEWKWED